MALHTSLRRRLPLNCVALAAAALISVAAVRADSVDIAPSKDNTLYQPAVGEVSNGAGAHIFAGNDSHSLTRRAVLAFDIAGSVPAGATITAVTLTLNMSRTIAGAESCELHRLSADWGEGTSQAPGEEGAGAPAATGDATWVHRFYPNTLWTTPGGDFISTVSDSVMVSGVGP